MADTDSPSALDKKEYTSMQEGRVLSSTQIIIMIRAFNITHSF